MDSPPPTAIHRAVVPQENFFITFSDTRAISKMVIKNKKINFGRRGKNFHAWEPGSRHCISTNNRLERVHYI